LNFRNSLDAGATSINISLEGNGLNLIQVRRSFWFFILLREKIFLYSLFRKIRDNGSGIPKESYSTVGLPHYTSKICEFTDLETLSTYGFRGEGLSSLCSIAGSVTIITRTLNDPTASKLTLNNEGALVRYSFHPHMTY
jgi:DNA mismatch repair protein PMS2